MFVKTGQAQPFTIATEVCQLCGQGKAEFLVDGKMICSACKEKAQPQEQK